MLPSCHVRRKKPSKYIESRAEKQGLTFHSDFVSISFEFYSQPLSHLSPSIRSRGMECVFCKIVNRQLPAEVLFESDRVLSILDIRPIHYGHALVMPKLHCADFLSVEDSVLQEVTHVTQLVARAIVETLSLKGFNVFSNNGSVAGQSVFHFHMHITPRYPDDNIKFVLSLKEYQTGAIGAYAERIREHITLTRRV